MKSPARTVHIKTVQDIDPVIESIRVQDTADVTESVRAIIETVRKKGDKGLIELAEKYDRVPGGFTVAVTDAEVREGRSSVGPDFKAAFTKARGNIETFHRRQVPQGFELNRQGVSVACRYVPVSRAGMYVPGGRHPLPSSALMCVIPAQCAGVREIAACTPPRADGTADPYILYALSELGVTSIFKAGGAQAAAALAFGTETVPRVDILAGPGNIYFTTAKKLLYGDVGIDMPAGPSEALIYIGDKAVFDGNTRDAVAWNVLSQAEHGRDSTAILVAEDTDTAQVVASAVAALVKRQGLQDWLMDRIFYITADKNNALAFINRYAPEHLQVIGVDDAEIESLVSAGVIFKGIHTPVAVGDFMAGPSHCLPTNGAARFASALGVYDFLKAQSIVECTKDGLKTFAPVIKAFTHVEGLPCHGRSTDV